MIIVPPGGYDSILIHCYEAYHEEDFYQVLVGARTPEALKLYVLKGFEALERWTLKYCEITFWKDGTQLELWSLFFRQEDMK